MIEVDPQTQQESEPKGYEFGYYVFDSLPAMEVANVNTTKEDTPSNDGNKGLTDFLSVPLPDETISQLQQQATFCSHICYIWVFIYIIIWKLCYYMILCLSIRVLKLST